MECPSPPSLSFTRGRTHLGHSELHRFSLASSNMRVGSGGGWELGVPSCLSLPLQLLPLLLPQHLQVVSPPHGSLSEGRDAHQ